MVWEVANPSWFGVHHCFDVLSVCFYPLTVTLRRQFGLARDGRGRARDRVLGTLHKPCGGYVPYFHFVGVSDTVTPPFVGLGVVYDAIE